MFPIRDHNPSQRRPVVTWLLIAANIALYLLTLPGSETADAIFVQLALYPGAVTRGEALWGLVSHMFLHAGLMHLAGNLLFLWIFGDNMEDQMGHAGFALFYLSTGLAAAAAQIAAMPGSTVPMVGASGAIAGVMGGYLLMFPRARVDVVAIFIVFFKVFTLPAWLMLLVWFAIQILGGLAGTGSGGGVAYWAHAGGFAAGLVLCLPLFLRRGGPAFWTRTEGHPPHPAAVYGPSRVPPVSR